MLTHKAFFEGQVQSVGFERNGRRQSAGVVDVGEFHFGTDAAERMHVISGELWAKLVVNCAYNALSAITQLPYGKMIAGPGIRDVMRDVVEETLALAKSSGVTMAPDTLARTYRIAEAMPTQFSSTAQDLARGKPTEIEHLNGFVVRRGAALGVPTPANRALYALVRLLESKPRA